LAREKKPKKHPAYWKVKSAFYEVQQTQAHAQAAVAASEAKFVKTLTDAGLDPKVIYALNDDTESITPKV
jgi:hypothetical protein